jgi:iron complex outermembrane recepter protein
MSKLANNHFKKTSLFLAMSSALAMPTFTSAQEQEIDVVGIERIQVTASRRASTVQEAPLNITALDADVMKDQNIAAAEDVARWVPGLTISEQGGREGSAIIVRGLNTNSSERGADGGTVATYLGEIPFNADLRLTDIERVEVLIGPQGTLYGAGTLGGAIRYMLKQPEMDITEGEITGDLFTLSESDGTGAEAGFIFNTPIIDDVLAVRASVNYFDTPGYVDYATVVKNPGTSLVDFRGNESEIENNIKRVEDVNDEQITTARLSLRWQPNDWFDGTINYFYQKQENGGNSIVQDGTINSSNPISNYIGEYESAYRVVEPNEKEDDLLSLELKADLGFAELVSASGWSTYDQVGQRDQTDLLYDIWSGYADFPAFVAYTRDTGSEDSFTQEIRLVSQSDSALSWIVGGYYNKIESESDDREYTPGLTDYWGGGIPNIEKDLEYIALSSSEVEEKALFGEVAYQINDKFNVTFGARFYEYEIDSRSGSEIPLYSGDFDNINNIDFSETHAEDDGQLFKFNTSYQFSDDVMGYFTVSEGFRIGGANGLKACPETLPEQQIVCALPNEVDYVPDTTTNYELGFKSTWLSNRLHFNAAIFNVDWEDAQIAAVTVNGQENITSNAGAANSKGVELSSRAMLSDSVIAYATYAYAKAELTEDAPFLFGVKDDQGSSLQNYYDGKDGDRLPGAPEHQFSMGISYETDVLDDKTLLINYGITAQSDVYTKVGLEADGEVLPGYALSNLSAKLSGDAWSATFYIDNMFDKYAKTSVRRDKSWAGQAKFAGENKNLPELQRVYGHYVTKPLTVGIKFNYLFEL